MKKIIILTCIFLLIFVGCSSKEPISKSEFMLDTVVSITIYDKYDEQLLTKSFDLIRQYENKFSKTIETSEVSKLNQANGKTLTVSDDMIDILTKSKYYSEITSGAFDVTIEPLTRIWDFKSENPVIPDDKQILQAIQYIDYNNIEIDGNNVTLKNGATIDLGGIAKGYIASKTREFLIENGVKHAIINLGGNVQTIGDKNNKDLWKVGIQKPYAKQSESIMSVSVKDLTVVTSGPYERNFVKDGTVYHHILDTNTGYPAKTNLYSVTIIAKNSTDADALSTSCFLLGQDKAIKLIESLDDVEAIFIDENENIVTTSGVGTKILVEYF